jgi:RNA polymerase sigma-70 factor (ECF subfamily)
VSTPQSPDPAQRFTALFDGAYGDVLRFVRRRHADEGAEDVVADAFLVAWRRLEDLPEDAGDARAWLFGIARGTLANSRRGDRRRDALGVRLADHGAHGADVPEEAAALRLDVGRSWRHLSAAEQEAIALTVLDGLTSAQAARVLGITPVAYRLRLSRARRRLRRLVEEGPPTTARAAARTADTAWEATS